MATVKTRDEIRTERTRQRHTGQQRLTIAALWPKKGENLGTLCRTLDALNGTLVIPATANAAAAVRKGNTLGVNAPTEFIDIDPIAMLSQWYHSGVRVVGVELAHGATRLCDLEPGDGQDVVIVLGHEVSGIPEAAVPYISEFVEIPMMGCGNSLNVAVAGSLVAYKLAGLV